MCLELATYGTIMLITLQGIIIIKYLILANRSGARNYKKRWVSVGAYANIGPQHFKVHTMNGSGARSGEVTALQIARLISNLRSSSVAATLPADTLSSKRCQG